MRPFGPSMKLGPSLSTDVFELNIQVTLEIFTQGCELALPAQCGYMNEQEEIVITIIIYEDK